METLVISMVTFENSQLLLRCIDDKGILISGQILFFPHGNEKKGIPNNRVELSLSTSWDLPSCTDTTMCRNKASNDPIPDLSVVIWFFNDEASKRIQLKPFKYLQRLKRFSSYGSHFIHDQPKDIIIYPEWATHCKINIYKNKHNADKALCPIRFESKPIPIINK